ncbi:MAG TPA: lytic transglycosylase domain-containing protein, partial [Dongiaceae bacterium]|nr:lytic transglycosylase domain-containing protein [Dongiaceae bacterium]
DQVLKHAATQGLDPDWVYSVIRQESAFMPAAKSPVGALGIMQIMPGTAKLLSRSMRIPTPNQQQLLDPSRNIQMGTYFLKQLSDQFDGNIVLATAAYNAGPGRARAWQPEMKAVSGDIWIETIPFKETRDYVKNIVTYQAIYRHLLGRDVTLSRSVAAIPPKFEPGAFNSETAAR